MAPQKTVIELADSGYVPVLKDSVIYYGGSQMWFPTDRWFSKNYVLHNYGCGTIATADLFLYLALKNETNRTDLTEIVLQGTDSAYYMDYLQYVSKIDQYYTKTKRWLAVLGPKVASAINDYTFHYDLKYRAKWRLSLSYYDMLDAIEEMLSLDIPVIFSIGPNTPNLWGKKGITFYQQYTLPLTDTSEPLGKNSGITSQIPSGIPNSLPNGIPTDLPNGIPSNLSDDIPHGLPYSKPLVSYRYKAVKQDINGHYVTITGIRKDAKAATTMLRISSWGKEYFINYEEYRDYVNDYSGTFTSSIVYIN